MRGPRRLISVDVDGEEVIAVGHWSGSAAGREALMELLGAAIRRDRWERLELERWADDGGRVA